MPSKKKQEVETPEPDEAENSASESEPETKKPVKKSAFAMMMDSDDDDEDEEEEKSSPSPKKSESGKKKKEDVSEEIAMFGEKKKKKKKEATDEKEEKDGKKEKKDKKEKKEGKEKKKRGPTVCEVTEVSAVPKKDKLKLCKVAIIVGMDPVEIVTSAPNVTAGHKFIAAPPGYTTANGIEVKVAKVGGIESAGMFCGPKEMGWDTDILDGDLAIMLADSAEVGSPAPPYEEAVAAFQQREKEAKQKQEEEAKAAAAASAKDDKKGKKKKGKAAKEADEDLDELLAEFKEDAPAEPAEKPQEESVPTEAAGVAAGAGGAAGKSASQKKKDKKKGNKGTTDAADDDFDAALEEYKPEPADAAQPEDQDDNKAEDEGLDAKTLANRKKKEKKKAKQQEKTGGEGLWATAPEEEQGESKEPAAASSSKDEAPAAAAKKGAKKESAIVKAARERLEQEQKLAEEKRAFEEAERQRVEEEQRQIEEEERKKEEERQRKRDHKAAKIAKQKAEGTYLTKKQKEQAKRAAQLREQFGYNMGKDEDEEAEEEAEKPQKRPMATKKKKRPQRMQETEETAEKETEKLEEETKPEPEVEKPTPVEETKEEEDDDDDWEKKLEEEAEEKSPKAAEAEAAESDDDKDSDSDSDSDSSSSSSSSSITPLRSPVICIMGHVDTGKTKLLDKIRRTNVQEGEAGGITQQIGATFFPDIALQEQTKKVDEDFDLEVPGVLIIDTPGHESFNNLRMRGSSLADLAILVIDIMHGLEPQTVESLELLKKRKCPFIIALNKIDILYKWNSKTYTGIQDALGRQEDSVREEFRTRFNNVVLQLNERGLNCNLYWENPDYRTAVSIVPTSALTGEGVPDLLYMILKLTQDLMVDKLEVREELECTVIEVKNIEGLGTTIDVVLLNGTLKEGDTIVLAGIGGPIVTTIRALLTPQPMKEMRVKNEYVHHAQISTSMGVKISAPGLEDAVAGTELLVLGPDDDLEELKEDVSEGFESILNDFEKEPAGVYVKASTLGSLEALLSFLQDMKIPVFDVGIGEVHKRDVKKACIMKEKKHPEYALILAFDVKVNQEAQKQADTDGVTIFTADIIYHLQDKFTKYMEKFRESQKTESKKVAVFPVVLSIDKQHIFRKQDPIILGCQVVGGQLRTGTPICIPDKQNLVIGHVAGIENNKKTVQLARRGDTVCVKIEQTTAQNHIMYGRHFDHNNQLYSQISRQSIDTLKEHFKDEMKKEDWELIIGMKKVFEIQ